MNKMSGTIKGLITGVLMIITTLLIYQFKGGFSNNYQYITYALYIAGIVWTLKAFRQSSVEFRKFGSYFSAGFKCFVVVTLLMVIFTYVFLKAHPELTVEMAKTVREDLVTKGDKTPDEIETQVNFAKNNFTTMMTSTAIFGYLIIGALITAVASAFLMQKKGNAYKQD